MCACAYMYVENPFVSNKTNLKWHTMCHTENRTCYMYFLLRLCSPMRSMSKRYWLVLKWLRLALRIATSQYPLLNWNSIKHWLMIFWFRRTPRTYVCYEICSKYLEYLKLYCIHKYVLSRTLYRSCLRGATSYRNTTVFRATVLEGCFRQNIFRRHNSYWMWSDDNVRNIYSAYDIDQYVYQRISNCPDKTSELTSIFLKLGLDFY